MNIRKFSKTLRVAAAAWALCATAAFADTTIEFIQWWEPEMPAGALRHIMDDFEAKNPGIKVTLVSGPYATTHDQIVVGAASGTLSDVVGLDGAWVNGLAKQGAIASMDELMTKANYDKSQIADIIKVDGKSVMFPLASFVYPVFVNLDLAKAAGVDTMPTTRSEFAAAAKKMTDPAKNEYGWVLPLSLQSPSGVQNDVMSWVWASGASMLKDGKPDLENPAVVGTLEYIEALHKDGVISPGIFAKKEQDKVEEFVNGRVGMMIDSLAHVNLIRQRNPKLNFGISAMPATDGYTGKRGLPYASWGIGISDSSQHKEEAWKLVEYLMSPDVNGRLVSIANAFPGNVKAKPDFVASDPIFAEAFKIFQSGYPANEFVGLPVAEELMRDMNIQIQKELDGGQTAKEAAANTQKAWLAKF
ncbi:sugar ABC transporter substrate-binding protein [Agrobacterium sp. SHOUNA12C]|uniref:ABC transporter substrate-binding protein n=1 Tax=Rhizobium rhizogenes NBRC 13257 TaxID=1220581 RepID=A0AA87U859_RHIRH|nr:sugar ABC transporter substrate-binding protein [Rhizobium rhizogenes]KAA6482973.1 sugar ABC transporter substrate-binding protein [Agrobacterium sp. ICMP 7243]MCJ9719550.1 sugar ABC transporter substrate-binding protein [Agrobacterium sp. BETTINA12B]MCJ9761150.1 sugar ABC transporter substrate-binding protein [Agrobacterium sp. SHOUNA12C]OCJ02057.1 sugar ABC transporter substrate-binding protein [Agrobacterium sp. 13-626]OCJ15508.1 sugar ABC transporter substrate-binding protein [Agrobacte